MELLSPWSLAWLGLLAPLVLLYVLKRRREPRTVGSTLLWEAALRDLRAERPWQRLRPHLSLLLQALVLLAGAVALARPAGAGQVPSGARLAVVVDVSSSMAARDAEGVRIERACEVVRSLARSLPEGGAMMIVAAGPEAEVVAAPTADRVRLERGIDRLRPGGPAADLEGAVAVAAERLQGAPAGSRVLVLTDAAFDGQVTLAASSPVEVQRIGEASVNHAIVALDVRPRPSEDAPDRADVYARLARFGAGSAEARLVVSAGGAVLETRRVTLEGGAPLGVVVPVDLPPDADARAPVVEVRLEALDGPDPFPLDDLAVAPSPAARRLPVFLVGDAPRSVRRVLRADREVELYAIQLAELAERGPLDGLHVFAGETPARAPAGDSVVVAPRGASVFGAPLGEPVPAPRVVAWEEADERLRFVPFGSVHLGPVRPIEGASARALLTTDAGIALGALTRPAGETTVVAFDPDEGDWASGPGFVVFFRNLLERARRRRAAGGIAQGPLGAPLTVPAPDGGEVRVTTPSGRVVVGAVRDGVALVEVPAEPGVYDVAVGERRLRALRSLLDAQESDLRPRAQLTRGGAGGGVEAIEPVEHHEAWPWLAGALLVLLLLEVLWASRRGAVA